MVTGGGLNKTAAVVCLLTAIGGLSACSQTQDTSKYQRPAPLSSAQTGWNISGASVEDLEKLEASGATVRELNANHGMYEITGLDQTKLTSLVPGRTVEKNRYIEKLFVNPKEDARAFSISYCDDSLVGVQVSVETTVRSASIIKRSGETLTFTFKSDSETALPYVFVVEAPETSALNGLRVKNAPLNITPDDMGSYWVRVLTKVGDTVCWTGLPFGVTDSVPYQGARPADPIDTATKLLQFAHLRVLQLDQVWTKASGSGVVVAIVDTGLNYNHPDLSNNVAINSREVAGNGVDDDRNGFVDDVYGWNFVARNNTPYDDQSHGTHVSGLATANVGLAYKARVLPIKVMNAFGGGDLGSIAAGLRYAVDQGARIVNVSLGGEELDAQSIKDAIAYGERKNVLFVVAAGNETSDIDAHPTYPASLPNENILSVAATDLEGRLTSYTNTGASNVDLAAPGGSDADGGLKSAAYENSKNLRYVQMMGTSMASPVVAGAAALVLSKNPTLSFRELKAQLMDKGTYVAEYAGKLKSQKKLSVLASLNR